MDNKITFGYWNIRGLGQVSRLILAYSGLSWHDQKYASPEEWFAKDKNGLALDFPNLPYIVDGDFKLTESRAINLYIIKKSGKTDLLGKNIEDQARVQSVIGVSTDVRYAFAPLLMDPEWQSKLTTSIVKASPKLQQLDKFYGEKSFALGYLTLADFVIAEFSHYVEKIAPQQYAKHAFLGRLRSAIDSLPEIKAYYESQTAMKSPFLPAFAPLKF